MADIVKYKFHRTEIDILPIFNDEFEYTFTDIIEGSTIVRTITSDMLPTRISFKRKNILKIETLNLDMVEELDLDTIKIED